MTDKERITEILKTYTKKHNIMASSVILEEYAEELVRQGVVMPIRCKDCKWYQNLEIVDKVQTRCFNLAGLSRVCNPNDFCNYGERKDEE